MKKNFLLSVVATFICSMSFAKILRVGFFGPAVSGVDYSTFQLAHDASNAGDTIMMMPGSKFGSATMIKRLVVIGPGYFLSQNAALQANPLGMDTTNATEITIGNQTASNSIFIGCTLSYALITGVNIADITFQRCWFIGTAAGRRFALTINESVNNFTFLQCVFKDRGITAQAAMAITNIAFINCLFYSSENGFDYGVDFSSALPHSGIFQNCIFSGFPTNPALYFPLTGTWLINNSIANIPPSYFVGSGITFQNCIGTGDQFPVGNGNQQNQSWINIFKLTGSQDGQYALKAGSPAIGAGIGGTNCGIFGGTSPYRLSGIPSVPTIFAITSPQGSTPTVNTVQINLSTRSNN
jgi:hypothetical protein